MRLRCVSKSWNLTIRDPNFSKLHKTISQTRPATTILLSFNGHAQKLNFYQINREREAIHELTIDISKFDFDYYWNVTEIVNGLVCFCNHRDVIVCNISTHEVIVLPPQPINPSVVDPIYSLGYDPLNNEYKVLSIWRSPGFCKCMVFIVGKSSEWRDVIDLLDSELAPEGSNDQAVYRDVVYNDGVLHWLTALPYCAEKHGLVLFNVKEEKFKVIVVPFESKFLSMLRIGSRIVVLDCLRASSLEDYQKEVWIERGIRCQPGLARPIGIVADKLIYDNQFSQRDIFHDRAEGEISQILFSYDPKYGGILQPAVVRGVRIRSAERLTEYSICEITEDIYPLQHCCRN